MSSITDPAGFAPPLRPSLHDIARATANQQGVLVLDNDQFAVKGQGSLNGREVAWVDSASQASRKFITTLQADCGPALSSLLLERFGLSATDIRPIEAHVASQATAAALDGLSLMDGIAAADRIRAAGSRAID